MSQNKSDRFGLAILIIIIVASFVLVLPFFRFSCSRVVIHDFLGLRHGETIPPIIGTDLGVALLPLLIMFVLWTAVSLWVYHDAEKRNHSGLLWGLFVYIGSVIGLIIYLIVRVSTADSTAAYPAAVAMSCPSCGKSVQRSFVACPYCGTGLAKECSHCGKRVESDWKVCPYCQQPLENL
jgi:hypothetical protein